MVKILICDDEKDIVNALKIYLNNPDYTLLEAYNGLEALNILKENDVDLGLLDIMMPVMDGIRTLSEIRRNYQMPVIFLSAKREDADKILGLNVGADDYITKPFNPLELVARVKSQIRRYVAFGSLVEKQGVLTTGGLSLDTEAHQVTVDGEEVHLTATEYKIVEYLMRNMGRTLSSTQIYENVWNENAFASDKTVTVHIRRIREKIEIDSRNPKYLKVVWGIGYKIEKI